LHSVIRFLEPLSPFAFNSSHLFGHNAYLLLFIECLGSIQRAHDEVIEGNSDLLGLGLLLLAPLGSLGLLKRLTVVKLSKSFVFVLDLVLQLKGERSSSLGEGLLYL
jgi:hypothetical protein